MNEESLVQLLNLVLGMGIGDSRVLREGHLYGLTVHRYRDGWYFLFDEASDFQAERNAIIGWAFHDLDSVTDFLSGRIGERLYQFNLKGEGA